SATIDRAVLDVREVDPVDARRRERHAFGDLGDAVAVQIEPQDELREDGIIRIDSSVVVGVVLRQCRESVVGERAGAQEARRSAEELRARGYPSRTVGESQEG